MVVTKDRPHGPGRSIPTSIVVECEDHSAIQAPLILIVDTSEVNKVICEQWFGWWQSGPFQHMRSAVRM